MANVAVKFYSMSAQAYEAATKSNGALYFVTNGELYKGAQRFGANKVFTVPANTTIEGETDEAKLSAALTAASVTGAIGGDILTGYGAAKVFNGSTWVDLGADVSSIVESIPDGAASASANGIIVSVATTHGSVTGVQVSASQISCESVTANTGTFTNLVVSSSATFDVTEVVASSLTVNGSTVEEIADARISAATLTGSISASAGTSLVNEGQVVEYVSAQLQSFGNAMHFTGVVTSLPSEASAGDIVVIGTPEEGQSLPAGLSSGQEYVYDGTNWEKFGDESIPSGGSSVSAMNGVSVEVITAQATAAPTVTLSGFGVAATKSVATSIGPAASIPATGTEGQEGYVPAVEAASDANLATEKAVRDSIDSAISAAELVWLDENNSPIIVA